MGAAGAPGLVSLDERVEELLARMTLAEKVAQLGGAWFGRLLGDDGLDDGKLDAALGHGIGHVTSVANDSFAGPERTAALANRIQRFLVERTRLGIPALLHEEAVAGLCAKGATQFPQAIGLAGTWDPSLMEEVAASIRRHMLAVGARVALAPVVDIASDPRWGRLEETYGEDPELASRMAVAYVRGLQGDDPANGVLAIAKHFLAHGAPDGGFNHGAVTIGARRLRDVIAAPFRAAIHEAGLAGVMSAYHEVDGLPCTGSPEILTALLRHDLGFEGVVVSDYWAVTHLETFHHVAAGPADAARQALAAGVDVELPALDRFRHLSDEAGIDRAVRRVLAQKFALGLFEHPYVDPAAAALSFDTPADRVLARRAAAASLVLLTNDGTLPIAGARTVAVVGPAADDRRLLLGDYHYPAHVEGVLGAPLDYVDMVTPLDGLRAAMPHAVVEHVAGVPLAGDVDLAELERAVAAARESDVAVVFVGGLSGVTLAATSGELRDVAHLELPPAQRRLVAEVAGTGTPTVVVVVSGRAHALTEEVAAAGAVVLAWVPGEEGGAAIAQVLTGATPPSGRLPVSLLRTAGQVGVGSGHHKGGGRSELWGSYVDEPAEPLFPLGHGLSYTTFSYADLVVTAASTADPVRVALTVANTGRRAGDEVVQLYLRDEVTSVGQPERRLLAFARVPLDAGQTRRVVFDVPAGRLAFTGRDGRSVVEPGAMTFMVGASWADVRLRATVELAGAAHYPDLNTVAPCRHSIEEGDRHDRPLRAPSRAPVHLRPVDGGQPRP
jgi:beta-glucosidase